MSPTPDRMEAYVGEVMRFRRALNLTSVRDPKAFHERFIAPSLAMAEWLRSAGKARGRLLDVGSGMGVPGVPLLIALPELHGVLVERRMKRAEFLRHVARRLKIHADVHAADVQALPHLGVDVCVARAVTDQRRLLGMFARHARADAVAVLPVPRESRPLEVASFDEGEWRCLGEDVVRAGDEQVILRYGFIPALEGGASRRARGGFT